MTSPRTRVDQLIALATNDGTSEEERRTAAMAAIRLIKQHSMLDGGAAAPEPKVPSISFDELLREMFRNATGPRPSPWTQPRVKLDDCPACGKGVFSDQHAMTHQLNGRKFHRECANHGPCGYCAQTCFVSQEPKRVDGVWYHQTCRVARAAGVPRIVLEQSAKKLGMCKFCNEPYFIGDRVWNLVDDELGFEHAVCHYVRVSGAKTSEPAAPERPRRRKSS